MSAVRTKIRYDYSYISSAAIKINDDVLEVAGWGDYLLNGVDSAAMDQLTISGYDIAHEQPYPRKHEIYIALSTFEGIKFNTFKDWVSVQFVGPVGKHFEDSVGLFGNYHTGERLGRDGVSVIEDDVEFGGEWQVRDTEPSLFATNRPPQYPQACRLPDPVISETTRRRLGAADIGWKEAEEACAGWGEDKEHCIWDVIKSGDLELAEAGGY